MITMTIYVADDILRIKHNDNNIIFGYTKQDENYPIPLNVPLSNVKSISPKTFNGDDDDRRIEFVR